MTRSLYALLVGIDEYQPPVPPLYGCCNDIAAIESLLRERTAAESFQLVPRVLTNAQATRQALVDGFRSFLCTAASDDVVLFYYSGHGGQQKTHPAFWHLEPDRLDETLVCYDSRSTEAFDLADKELSKLIAEVARRDPHIVVVLDCCHSGSGTRAALVGAGRVRRAPLDRRERPLESYLVSPAELGDQASSRSVGDTRSDWISLPRGKHVLISACRADEEAKEYQGDGQQRGALSYFLADALRRAGGQLTYRDLFKQASARVRTSVARQTPQIEATDISDLDLPFLGGAVAPRRPYFTLSYDRSFGWVIDGGRVHGIPPGTATGTTVLALFPLESSPEQLEQVEASLGEARVLEAQAHLSRVAVNLRSGGQPPEEATYKAVVTVLPIVRLGVFLDGDPVGVMLVRGALGKATPGGTESLYVEEVDAGTASLRLLARDGMYRFTRPAEDRPLIGDIAGYSADGAARAVESLEHIARWTNTLNLDNPTGGIGAGDVRIEVYALPPLAGDAEQSPEQPLPQERTLRLEYTEQDGVWHPPRFRVRLHNIGERTLYCALLDLTELYAVSTGLIPGGSIKLSPGEEGWALDGQPIQAIVPEVLSRQGVTEFKDVLKLIASTAEFDPTLLEMQELDAPVLRRVTRSTAAGTRDVMPDSLTRALMPADDGPGPIADWTTNEITITTVRPREEATVPTSGAIPLGSGVKLLGHAALKAHARLTTIAEAGRDVGNLLLPPILRDDPGASMPLQFTSARGGDPGLAVLELRNVEDHAVVTPERPLVLNVNQPLGEDEHVLPVAYDGEFFLPLGYARRRDDGMDIVLDRLPAPTSHGARDLGGSVRILFQKLVGERVGIKSQYPLLAAAYVANDGAVTYWTSSDDVRARVEAAQRIVLCIHGVIGDTRGMVRGLRGIAGDSDAPLELLAGRYDLCLAFDYENINTPIEETARALKQRLAAVGLGPRHGKNLHIVAHSMGGLVARWFVEREGGNQVVQRLVLVGTPNAGSPWPSIQAWSTVALGAALNTLSVAVWPAAALNGLLAVVERVDVTLDQMMPGSDLLNSLAASPDPGVPYVILAGNTSIIPAALKPEPGQRRSRFTRLVNRLVHLGTALTFFWRPNDIAVSVESIKRVPMDRSPAPIAHDVACDHMTYFTSVTGLSVLAATTQDAGSRS